jgi:rRNA small subunit pseudouridine methyltransferase Nep1
MTLILVLADAALQRVPHEISSHPQVKKYAKRRGKHAEEVLLDRSFHHSAMKRLPRTRNDIFPEKMGRPDIVHNTLLQVLETPLNWENKLRVLIHTQDEYLININQKIRLPKNYVRFVGLIEQLFEQKKLPLTGEPLLTLERVTAKQVVSRVEPTKIIGLSKLGRPRLLRNVADDICSLEKPMVLIGAFPRGHFSRNTSRIIDETYSVDRSSLDAWVVAGRFVYDFEWAIGLAEKRADQ